MSSGNSMNGRIDRIRANAIRNASHGEFFFARWSASNGYERESPCLVISDHQDPHDEIIILKVTTKPARTEFDVPIQLKYQSIVRTNKIYTIQRRQLLFPINKALDPSEYGTIVDKLKKAQKIEV
jgi:hypothetical protein